MPELPEVEIVIRELQAELKDQPKLESVTFLRKDLRNVFPRRKIRSLVSQPLHKVERRSKYLLFYFNDGHGLLSHLGMTGHWRIERGLRSPRSHDHICLQFSGGRFLIYNDPRRFGFFDYFDRVESHKLIRFIGPEPFSSDFHADYLKQKLKGRKAPIKNALMDQRIVAGIGNIYASEILYRALIRPKRPAGRITLSECDRIVQQTRQVLQESIQFGGSSFDDYRHVSGKKGGFQQRFRVYSCDKQPCLQCGNPIRRAVHGGRSTFWCAKCQK